MLWPARGRRPCTSRVSPAWVRDESSYHIREIRPGSAEDTPHKSRILLFAFWAWGGKREGYQVVRLRVYNCYARTELCKVLGGRDEGRRTMDHYTLDITIYIGIKVAGLAHERTPDPARPDSARRQGHCTGTHTRICPHVAHVRQVRARVTTRCLQLLVTGAPHCPWCSLASLRGDAAAASLSHR